ncbi:type I restriction-modification system subunit M [Selenomonas ruminis]|uniref:site-specific DNA-methyltransferase (adenine-specific) n=1 Tax=Selenomonas ruminis TaxID=2593411 RepID=A0A5D6WCE1_9FIRM|nr:class I SAM-dependent DNA methyltransferase [Selenomonas sp. mPRGC5]TYZ24689.1 SAM-dependent DNA methyltransferase [Selenomonas sp. mPRGC5]
MLVGEERNKVDRIWDTFHSGGLTNPATVIEQFNYLLFLKQLDDIETKREAKARLLGIPYKNQIFSPAQQNYRWSALKNMEPETAFHLMQDEIFPFLKNMHADADSAYSRYMANATFDIPSAAMFSDVVEQINNLDLSKKDSKGDLYEYMLSKLATSGTNGQFRTPRHIIKMMVEMVQPRLTDKIVDPAMGSAGFLVAAEEYLRKHYEKELMNKQTHEYFDKEMFYGFDTDPTMLRIGAMNMMLHNVQNPNIDYRDSLSDSNPDTDLYTLVLANPPFKGSLKAESVADSLLAVTSTKKTELLFLSLFLRILQTGGRAAVIVPDGVLFGSSKAHKAIRKEIVENNKLTAVISMPGGVFKPYAGVSTAILFFTKTGVGGTDKVWFYDMKADGYSLDDKRQAIDDNDIPDIIARFNNLEQEEGRKRTEQSFFVPVDEIKQNGFDLSINKYKEIEYVPVEYPSTLELMTKLDKLNMEFNTGMEKLKEMLGE